MATFFGSALWVRGDGAGVVDVRPPLGLVDCVCVCAGGRACEPPPQPASTSSAAASAALPGRDLGRLAIGAPTRDHLPEAADAEDEDEGREADGERERCDRYLLADGIGSRMAAED